MIALCWSLVVTTLVGMRWFAALLLVSLLSGEVRAETATLLVFSELRGELLPCDCAGKPQGGITYLAGAIEAFRREHPHRTTKVLALGSHFAVGDPVYYQRARYTLEAYGRMGVDVVTLGPRDYQFGMALLDELAAMPFRALAFHRDARPAVELPHRVEFELFPGSDAGVELSGWVQDGFVETRTLPFEDVSFPERPPRQTGKSGDGPFRIAIVTAATGQMRRIYKDKSIDLILVVEGSKTGAESLDLADGPVPLLYAGADAKHLLAVDLTRQGGETRIAGHRLIPITEHVKPLPAEVDFLERFLGEEQRLRADFGEGTAPASPHALSYAGAEACATCHADIVEQWRSSPHAIPQRTLEKQRRAVVRDFYKTLPREDVPFATSPLYGPKHPIATCETCHGAMQAHAQRPDLELPVVQAERSCSGCHAGTVLAEDAPWKHW